MRKIALLLVIMLVISIPLSVSAVEPRALDIEPILRFNVTTANCEVVVVGNNMSESIEVTMELMRGTYCVDRWTSSGYGYIHMEKTENNIGSKKVMEKFIGQSDSLVPSMYEGIMEYRYWIDVNKSLDKYKGQYKN